MTDRTERPLLFLDVDGPLLPFGEGPQREPEYAVPDSRLARLSPQTGLQLTALPCTLVWATTWEDEANTEISPRLGLPTLPVVNWPDPSDDHARQDQWFGLCWKTRPLLTWAAGRPFAWVDDEITAADRDWVSTHHPSKALLHHVPSSRGLTEKDFTLLNRWLRAT
jgi:hypothetical protein